jgi:hypothetical protein
MGPSSFQRQVAAERDAEDRGSRLAARLFLSRLSSFTVSGMSAVRNAEVANPHCVTLDIRVSLFGEEQPISPRILLCVYLTQSSHCTNEQRDSIGNIGRTASCSTTPYTGCLGYGVLGYKESYESAATTY